jgi:hypothetical protein
MRRSTVPSLPPQLAFPALELLYALGDCAQVAQQHNICLRRLTIMKRHTIYFVKLD